MAKVPCGTPKGSRRSSGPCRSIRATTKICGSNRASRSAYLAYFDAFHADLSHGEFISRVTAGKIAAGQLTAIKLERLMQRSAGQQWLPAGLTHLDEPKSERADVVRGLKTYVAAGPENAQTFAKLYAKLPSAQQVLPSSVLNVLER